MSLCTVSFELRFYGNQVYFLLAVEISKNQPATTPINSTWAKFECFLLETDS